MTVQETIPKSGWASFLNQVTKDHEGDDVTIEILGQDFGDQVQAERLPLAYISYDDADDVIVVGVGGRSGRYPVLLRHMVSHPAAVLADPLLPGLTRVLDIVDADGNQTLVHILPKPELPAR